MVQKLRQFEDKCFAEFNYIYELTVKEKVKEKIKSISNRTEEINERIEDMYFRQQIANTSIKTTETKLKKIEDVNQQIIRHLSNGSSQTIENNNNISDLFLTLSDSNSQLSTGESPMYQNYNSNNSNSSNEKTNKTIES